MTRPLVKLTPGKQVVGYAAVSNMRVGPQPPPMPSVTTKANTLTIHDYTLTLPTMKSGKNNMIVLRNGRHIPKKAFSQWRDEAVRQFRQQNGHSSLRNKHVILRCDIRYWPNDRRTRDVPGMEDALYHCLERAEIIANDGQIKHSSFTTESLENEVKVIVSLRVCP